MSKRDFGFWEKTFQRSPAPDSSILRPAPDDLDLRIMLQDCSNCAPSRCYVERVFVQWPRIAASTLRPLENLLASKLLGLHRQGCGILPRSPYSGFAILVKPPHSTSSHWLDHRDIAKLRPIAGIALPELLARVPLLAESLRGRHRRTPPTVVPKIAAEPRMPA